MAAGEQKGKRKVFATQGDGKVYSKDLRDRVVSLRKFSKRTMGRKAKIAA